MVKTNMHANVIIYSKSNVRTHVNGVNMAA